jgi:hypothetical protein
MCYSRGRKTPVDTLRVSCDIKRALKQQGALAHSIQIESVDSITKTALGKAPLIKARSSSVRSPQQLNVLILEEERSTYFSQLSHSRTLPANL